MYMSVYLYVCHCASSHANTYRSRYIHTYIHTYIHLNNKQNLLHTHTCIDNFENKFCRTTLFLLAPAKLVVSPVT